MMIPVGRSIFGLGLAMAAIAAGTLPALARPPEPAPIVQQARYTSAGTPLGTLLADPAARALVGRHFPDLLASRLVTGGAANRFTLRSLQRFRPTVFTNTRLAAIDADFARLPAR